MQILADTLVQILAVTVAVAAAIAAVLWMVFHWTRRRKTWCVILYHVSRDTNATFQWPGTTGGPKNDTLDEKLDQVVGEIESIPCTSLFAFVKAFLLGQVSSPGGVDWENVHVVYRALWNCDPIRAAGKPNARAKVVSWRPGAPSWPDDMSFATPNADDRDGFFRWAYENCPADHYAVFFWGHSIGPGGLFELSNSVAFPPLPSTFGWTAPASLMEVEETLRRLVELRQGLLPLQDLPPEKLPSGSVGGAGQALGAPGTPSAPVGASLGTPPPKVEIVLFQDCWMSTLETAFELKDVTRYVVASQSLVPIGYEYDASQTFVGPRGPVWPYTDLLSILLSNPNQFAGPVLGALQSFFDQEQANRLPTVLVPFTLLDLGQDQEIATNLTPLFQRLVQELAPLLKAERWSLFKNNTIVKFQNNNENDDLEAGEWALVDVRKLCDSLSLLSSYTSFNPPNATAIQAAATAIVAFVSPQPVGAPGYSLVRQVFESPTVAVAAHLGFKGISALWIPAPRIQTPAGDPYIANQIDRLFYGQLKFVTDTDMPLPGKSWADYAFEQKT